jgi:hypothetical protein
MQAVADEHCLPCATLGDDYKTRVEAFQEKYNYSPQSGVVEEEEEAWGEITIEHPMFKGAKSVNKRVINIINLVADVPKGKLSYEHYEIKADYEATALNYTRRQRKSRRQEIEAYEILLEWLESNTLNIWTYEDEMEIIEAPKPVNTEDELVERVKGILGKPTFEEYGVLEKIGGKGDLAYISEGTVLAIEVKRVVGRPLKHSHYVEQQAIKYSKVWKTIMSPRWTVYAITYTEYGFTLIDVFGEPKFPKKFAPFLDNIKIAY